LRWSIGVWANIIYFTWKWTDSFSINLIMEIKPIYVTFDQAKWFKEKGFDEKCLYYYLDNVLNQVLPYNGDYWCQNSKMPENYVSAPEQWQIIEWLRVNHNIHIQPRKEFHKKGYFVGKIHISDLSYCNPFVRPFDSPQEAYSAAFDYIIENNLI
jgi:hypothetical protein